MKIGLVVPTIREECILRFLKEWKKEFDARQDLVIFVVEDNPTKTFKIDDPKVVHLSWEDIDADLGEKSWIIPRRTDCVRSYGYYKAYQDGVDILITMDDDCYPGQETPYLIQSFIDNLNSPVAVGWFNTLSGRIKNYKDVLYPRGVPYKDTRDCQPVLCHGLWEYIPDFDGKTQLKMPDFRIQLYDAGAAPVPRGIFFPMCGMNVAVRREAIPAFYFLLMGQDKNGAAWGMHRFGDIWCGIFIKKIIDHLGVAAISGQPVIHHDRASNAEKNFQLESYGMEINEWLHREVEVVKLTGRTFKECYAELADRLPIKHEYFSKLKSAMKIWAELF